MKFPCNLPLMFQITQTVATGFCSFQLLIRASDNFILLPKTNDVTVTIRVIRDRLPAFVEGANVITVKRFTISEKAPVNSTLPAVPRITARDVDNLDPVSSSCLYCSKVKIAFLSYQTTLRKSHPHFEV